MEREGVRLWRSDSTNRVSGVLEAELHDWRQRLGGTMSDLTKKVHWWPTGNPSQPWRVYFEGREWEVVVIDGPGQQRRNALLIGGVKQEEFVDWPPSWTQEPESAANAAQRAEFEHEIEYWEKNKDVLPLDDDFEDEA